MKKSNYHEDIKDEKHDAAKYAVDAKLDKPNAPVLRKMSKEETGHMNHLKAMVKKSKAC